MSEERWWRADPSGVHTNVRSDGTTAPVAVGLPDSYLEVAFDPYRLTAGLSILATTSARFCDRPALAIEAVSRPHPDGQCLAWPHADAHRFMVDARYGSLLRYEALLDGQCFMLWEMQEVAFDETLPAELFIGPAGARLGFASPELEEALASRIDDLTRLVEGQSAVPGRPEPIGFVRSKIKDRKHAPRQGNEGAPDAWLVLRPSLSEGLHGIRVGDELIVITWFHEARRDVLKLHPRDDLALPLTGVFATRSPDRPNPLGLHRVTVLDISDGRLHVEPIEAIDGTPVVDIKPVLQTSGDF
jgi:tRNA-Thr(GGU) m(6)t(6)A37 methyltransferase TsaA